MLIWISFNRRKFEKNWKKTKKNNKLQFVGTACVYLYSVQRTWFIFHFWLHMFVSFVSTSNKRIYPNIDICYVKLEFGRCNSFSDFLADSFIGSARKCSFVALCVLCVSHDHVCCLFGYSELFDFEFNANVKVSC